MILFSTEYVTPPSVVKKQLKYNLQNYNFVCYFTYAGEKFVSQFK